MAKKANPDVSYLEVEKSFMKNKGKLDESMLSIGVDINVERRPTSDLSREKNLSLSRPEMKEGAKSTSNLSLSRPVMNKGVTSTDELKLSRPVVNKGVKNTAELNLSRPVLNKGVQAAAELNLSRPVMSNVGRPMEPAEQNQTPNVSLRKPDVAQEDDVPDKPSKLRIKPNLLLKMRKDKNENLNDVTLLKKPEVVQKPSEPDQENASANELNARGDAMKPLCPREVLLEKPEMSIAVEPSKSMSDRIAKSPELDGDETGNLKFWNFYLMLTCSEL